MIVDPTTDPRDSGAGPKNNWSPPTSSIRSFAGASPKLIPLEAHPDFELFRRRTEEANGFNLGHGNLSHFASTPSEHVRPRIDRRHTSKPNSSPKTRPAEREGTPDRMDLDGPVPFPTTSRDLKRTPERSSVGGPSFFDIPRQASPANYGSPNPPLQRNALSNLDDRHPRLSLPQNRADPPSPHLKLQQRSDHQRADTLPSSLAKEEDSSSMLSPAKLRDMMERLDANNLLLLDLRVFPQFSKSRLPEALNLNIPTTLVKRSSYNLQRLQDTFTNDDDKAKFAKWKSTQYIVVYDAYSNEKKDALLAINILKKFTNEGWNGTSYILKGGFAEFAKIFPHSIDKRRLLVSQDAKVSLSLAPPGAVPVAGGCAMPKTKNAANPFFSNIRQNQDLIDGVGQMDIKLPEHLSQDLERLLPAWLSKAAAKENHGKRVSDKFLNLELAEQSRMTKALSSGVSYGTPAADAKDVQIAGVEKGGKNRYNNIWPFEHARVKLQGRPEGACDYVNASHVKSSRSNKRYIASQGPLPATFDVSYSHFRRLFS